MTAKAFVLLSGGIDSAVCLKQALRDHEDVEAIHIDYGQQTEHIERRNAEKQAEDAGIPLHITDYRRVFKDFAEGTIEDKEYDRSRTSVEGHSVGYVPQRNLHLLVTAAAVAEHNTETGIEIVLYQGAQNDDEAEYPDCRPEFMDAAETAINRSTDQHSIRIENPLIALSKVETIQLGEELTVDWTTTFSCYNDTEGKPCRECPACLEREAAFSEVNISDPLLEK